VERKEGAKLRRTLGSQSHCSTISGPIQIYGLRLFLIAVFATSAIAKIGYVGQLADVLRGLFPIIGTLSLPAAFVIWILEFGVVALLGVPFRRCHEFGASLSLALGLSFLGANWIRFAEKLPLPCSCFGALFKMSPAISFSINTLIILFAGRLLVLLHDQIKAK
jgi:hypothetical protein